MVDKQQDKDKPWSKLSKEEVLKIKEMLKENVSLREIARQYNVTYQQIMRIRDKKHL